MKAFEIYCNFAAANRQAKELDNIARKLKYTAENYLGGKARSLDAAWNGEASDKFFEKETRLREKMLEEASSLRQVAEAIRRIARRTYETEMKALEVSSQRTY